MKSKSSQSVIEAIKSRAAPLITTGKKRGIDPEEIMKRRRRLPEQLKYISQFLVNLFEAEQVIGRPPGGIRPAPQPSIKGKKPPKEQAQAIAKLLKGRKLTREARREDPSLPEQLEFIRNFLNEERPQGMTTGTHPRTKDNPYGMSPAEKKAHQKYVQATNKTLLRDTTAKRDETGVQRAHRLAKAAAAKRNEAERGRKMRRGMGDWKAAAARAANDSTEYEGPSLSEQLEFIRNFLNKINEGWSGPGSSHGPDMADDRERKKAMSAAREAWRNRPGAAPEAARVETARIKRAMAAQEKADADATRRAIAWHKAGNR